MWMSGSSVCSGSISGWSPCVWSTIPTSTRKHSNIKWWHFKKQLRIIYPANSDFFLFGSYQTMSYSTTLLLRASWQTMSLSTTLLLLASCQTMSLSLYVKQKNLLIYGTNWFYKVTLILDGTKSTRLMYNCVFYLWMKHLSTSACFSVLAIYFSINLKEKKQEGLLMEICMFFCPSFHVVYLSFY